MPCMQVAGWCQDMCLNRARQRRRHRRTVEDWAHLWDHAANADTSPEFQAWMGEHGWQWQTKGNDPQVMHNPFTHWDVLCSLAHSFPVS